MDMRIKEAREERKERCKAMSSDERKALIREKMKAKELEEGSGLPGKGLSAYEPDKIWDLIQVTSYFPDMQTKPSTMR